MARNSFNSHLTYMDRII